jgi:hypothetical protein
VEPVAAGHRNTRQPHLRSPPITLDDRPVSRWQRAGPDNAGRSPAAFRLVRSASWSATRPNNQPRLDQVARGPVAEKFHPRASGLCCAPPGRPPAAKRGPDRPGDQRQRPKAALEYARHGRSIGGGSPLEEEVVLTPSRRQLRRREAGWEGSLRRTPAPRDANRVEGGAIWVSLLKKVKPVTINRVVA